MSARGGGMQQSLKRPPPKHDKPPTKRLCPIGLPGGSFDQKMLVPEDAAVRLCDADALEEMATWDGTERIFAWEDGVSVDIQQEAIWAFP